MSILVIHVTSSDGQPEINVLKQLGKQPGARIRPIGWVEDMRRIQTTGYISH